MTDNTNPFLSEEARLVFQSERDYLNNRYAKSVCVECRKEILDKGHVIVCKLCGRAYCLSCGSDIGDYCMCMLDV